MRNYIIDIETVCQAPEVLEARMPEELRNPVMPESLRDPQEVDLSGCPAYANIRDDITRESKRAAWKQEKIQKHDRSTQEARQKWELGVVEARTKFTQNAALDAKLGHAKLIGMKDAETGDVQVYVWEPDSKQMARIRAWERSAEHPKELTIHAFMREAEMLTTFFIDFKCAMDPAELDGAAFNRNQCVTYCGNSFDFPFLYRRSWLTGAPQAPLYRRGRYWDESRMVDLRDIWTFGSREDKDRSGGLANLAMTLGYEKPKLYGSDIFHKVYDNDPVDGIHHNLTDLAMTELAARKMGVVR